LNCSKCGTDIANGAAYCSACGQRQAGEARYEDLPPDNEAPGEPAWEPRESGPSVSAQAARLIYAGFWLRFAAYILDSLILGLTAGVAVFAPLMSRGAISPDNPWAIYTNTSRQYVALQLLLMMISWVYFALLESSPWQASIGKKMLGLMVTDMQGRRISFARATARYFCTLLSSFILMAGFIMIAFTEKKQGLHDILTGCLVIKRV